MREGKAATWHPESSGATTGSAGTSASPPEDDVEASGVPDELEASGVQPGMGLCAQPVGVHASVVQPSPSSQVPHAVQAVAPAVAAKVFGPQGVHAVDEGALENVPAGHVMQTASVDAVQAAVWEVPGAHVVQSWQASSAAYFPSAHVVQADGPGPVHAEQDASHGVQTVSVVAVQAVAR